MPTLIDRMPAIENMADGKARTRILAALRGEQPDRVPVVTMLGLSWMQQFFPRDRYLGDQFFDDPVGTIVELQERLGFDPVLYPFTAVEPEVISWPEKLFRWPESVRQTWRARNRIVSREDDRWTVERTIETPKGILRSSFIADRFQKWVADHPIKEEPDLDLLAYRPAPERVNADRLARLLDQVGDRAVTMLTVSGVWNEACDLRGAQHVATDVYERPAWLHRFLGLLADYAARLTDRLSALPFDVVIIDESFAGMGLSPKTFAEFILPYDRVIVDAARRHGKLVCLHDCGRGRAFLELIPELGVQALETLTPRDLSGDFDLAEAKRRVGDRLCLMGGFNERILIDGTPEQIRHEVRRCLDAAAAGGGYILRTCGQIFHGSVENIRTMTLTARELGRR